MINAGGVIYAWGTESLGWDTDIVESRLAGIGDTLAAIYPRAEADGPRDARHRRGPGAEPVEEEERWNV